MSSDARIEFVIQKEHEAVVLKKSDHIENLFNVRVSLSGQYPQGEWVTLHGPFEKTARAKKYILSLCIPEFGTEAPSRHSFTSLLFGEDSRLRNELERDFQTVIEPSSFSDSIHVQGSEIDVCLTVSKLAKLMDMMDNGKRSDCDTQAQSVHLDTTPYKGPGPTSSPADLDKQLKTAIQQMDADPSNIEKLSDSVKRALLEGLTTDVERKSTRSEVAGFLPCETNPQKEQKIEFFVRLGFPQEKVEAVLESLGPDTMDDDILARLVKVSSRSPASTGQKVKNLSNSRPRGYSGEPLLSTPVPAKDPSILRPVVVDGSNVAMRHGNGRFFSCKGILIAVQWFVQKGHQQVTVFVPSWRKEASRPETPISDQEILYQLEREGYLVFTPSRRIGTRKIVCYDDRFIVRLAAMTDGIIVSNDNFRDLVDEKPEWRETIEQRLLMFTFVNDIFMVPEDPLGRHGPMLDEFLQKDVRTIHMIKGGASVESKPVKVCPYGDRCTFGPKCRFSHPEREGREGKTHSRSPTPSPAPLPDRRQQHSERSSREDLSHLHSKKGSSEELLTFTDRSSGLNVDDLSEQIQRMGRQHLPGSPRKGVEPRHTHPMAANHPYHLNHPSIKQFSSTLAQSSPSIHIHQPPPPNPPHRVHSAANPPHDPMYQASHSQSLLPPYSQGAMREAEPRQVFLPRDPQLPGPTMPMLQADPHGIPPPGMSRERPAGVSSELMPRGGQMYPMYPRVPQHHYSSEPFRQQYDRPHAASSTSPYPTSYYPTHPHPHPQPHPGQDMIPPPHHLDLQDRSSLIPRYTEQYPEHEHPSFISRYGGYPSSSATARPPTESYHHSRESFGLGRESYGRESYARESYARESYARESYARESYGTKSYGHGRESYAHGRESYGHGRESYAHGRESYAHGRESFGHGRESYGRESYHHVGDSYSSHEPRAPRAYHHMSMPLYEQPRADQPAFPSPSTQPRSHRSHSLPHCLPLYPQTHSPPYPHPLGRVPEAYAGTPDGSYLPPPQSKEHQLNRTLYEQAVAVLPGCEAAIHLVMFRNPQITDISKLVELVKRQED